MSRSNLLFLLKSIVAIFIISFILDKIVYYTLESMDKKVMRGLGVGKLNRFFSVKDSVNFLVFGNSRAAHSINTAIIDSSSFNIGVDGTNFLYSSILVRTIDNSKPQLLLVQIDPPILFDENYIGTDAERLKVKVNNDTVKKYLKKYDLYNPFQNVYWSLAYNNVVFPILSRTLKPDNNLQTYYGYDPLIVSKKETEIFEKSVKDMKSKNLSERNCDTGKRNELVMKCFSDLKNFSLKSSKKIVFFTAPVFSDICKEDNWAISELMKEMNFHYLDYSDFFNKSNSFANWKDATHLSDIGARSFTEKVRTDLAKMPGIFFKEQEQLKN